MTEPTKNLLTRETCKAEMLQKEMRDFIAVLSLFLASLPAFAVLVVCVVNLVRLSGWIYAILTIPEVLLLAAALIRVIDRGVRVARIKKGAFSIVTDKVSEKREELVRRGGRRRHLENVLYFVHYGRYVPSSTVYQLTDEGDVFFLVIPDGRKQAISIAYHSDMYTDRERSY